jgi:hypothetical protein
MLLCSALVSVPVTLAALTTTVTAPKPASWPPDTLVFAMAESVQGAGISMSAMGAHARGPGADGR